MSMLRPGRAACVGFLLMSVAAASACATARGASTLFGGTRPSAVEPNIRQAAASTDPADAPQIQPDRPDVTNSAYAVPKGLLQLEVGAQYSEVTVSGDTLATPFSIRLGVAHWAEARVETDGLTRNKEESFTSTQFPGVTLGAKLRLWAPSDGWPVIALLPAIGPPWGRSGGTGTDYLLRVASGGDLPRRCHLDVNYGVAALAGDQGGHFVQHMASASSNVAITSRWSPYVEIYWFSKLEPGARPAVGLDTGISYAIGERLALDGGVAFGLTSAVNGPAVFGGLSVIAGRRPRVHERLIEAQARGDR